MKKLLFIFIIGQLLVLSFIFHKSIYEIYEIQNIGNSNLTTYKIKNPTSDSLKKFYKKFKKKCISCELEIIKTPISNDQKMHYDIYNSKYPNIQKYNSINIKNVYTYKKLKINDFVDSTGQFKTDIQKSDLLHIAKEEGVTIENVENDSKYKEIIEYNWLNLSVLLILTLLVFYLYIISISKKHAIKKLLGFSTSQIILNNLKTLCKYQILSLSLILIIHSTYLLTIHRMELRYIVGLFLYLIIVISLNGIVLFFSHISLRFININNMLKNKEYSQQFNFILKSIKYLLIILLCISFSQLLGNYKNLSKEQNKLAEAQNLNNYFSANGYNSDSFDKINENPTLHLKYSKNVEKFMENYKQKILINNTEIFDKFKPSYAEISGRSIDDLMNDPNENLLISNKKYINEILKLKDLNDNTININNDIPTVLVPKMYEKHINKIKKNSIEKINDLYQYNKFNNIKNTSKIHIKDIDVIWIKNNQTTNLMGKNIAFDIPKIKNSVVLLDTMNFDNSYYLNVLSNSNLFLKMKNRSDFEIILKDYDLDSLLNPGSLITPIEEKISYVNFILYNSLVFSLLFFITLVLLIYISNKIEILTNRKSIALKKMYGFSDFKILSSNILGDILILPVALISIWITFNIQILILILVFDLIILYYLYIKIILNDLPKNIKGGS